MASTVDPPTLVESPSLPKESSVDPPPAAMVTDQRRQSFEWPTTEGTEEVEQVLVLCPIQCKIILYTNVCM